MRRHPTRRCRRGCGTQRTQAARGGRERILGVEAEEHVVLSTLPRPRERETQEPGEDRSIVVFYGSEAGIGVAQARAWLGQAWPADDRSDQVECMSPVQRPA